MQSRHHPSGNAINHFDNAGLEKLIATHQNGDPSALGAIVEQVQERARTLIRFHHTTKYQPEDALLSDINFRLVRNVGKFDSARGSAFTFVSALIWNCLRTNVTAARKFASRHVELDEAATEKLTTGPGMLEREAIEDFTSKLRHGVKSVLTDEGELATQRWYIDSFCDEDFASPRHRCANSCMRAYGVGHARSRELYDLTMAEARRVLYDELKDRRTVFPGQLWGTRSAWMTAYAPLLSRDEFTKFAVIMRGLAPYLLLLILDPAHENNHRRDRNPTVGRRNLELILYGHPLATRLFPEP